MSKVFVLGISGPSCSGKTTLARILRKVFSNSVIVHQDDFYKPDTEIPIDPDTGLDNWDCPESFDSVKMHQSLQYAREHNGELPNDHPRGEDSNTHDGSMTVSDDFLSHLREMIPKDVDSEFRLVLVDGILLFWDPLIYKQFDCSFFIHAGKDTLKQRRESRQGYVTQEGYWVDPPGYFDQLVWPQYEKWNSHLFPDASHNQPKQNSIHELLIMNSDTENIEELATKAMNSLISHLQAAK
ncbi:unnamed protein product [Umbelopsis ramanniana]